MDYEELTGLLKDFDLSLPHFPDGRIDYSDSKLAPVVTVFVKSRDMILLLKRSGKVGTYRGVWNTVAGYIDEAKPLKEKILEELFEETGITRGMIDSIRMTSPYEFADADIEKTWIIFPALVELKRKPEIKLDWEHTKYVWVKPEDIANYQTVPNLGKSLWRVFN